jgi:glucose/mannose-6-phosphate isomerase
MPRVSDGPERMRALAADLPSAFLDGFRRGREIAPAAAPRGATVHVVGMGGSAIAADLARGLVEAETPLSLSIVRAPELPRAVDGRSRVVLLSYSGTTWETLRAYDAAGRVGAHRIVVTSGGELAERAVRDDVPLLTVPPGRPPRSAVGHLLGGLLGLLDPSFPESNEDRARRAAARTESHLGVYARPRGPAATLARRMGDRLPFVYADSGFLGLARRWKTQIEENAKRLAVFDEVPELLHNALVGWDAMPRAGARWCTAVLLEWSGVEGPVHEGFDYLAELLQRRGVAVVRVPLPADDRLEALLSGVALGDQVSLALAAARRVDPYPVAAIVRLKATVRPRRPKGK